MPTAVIPTPAIPPSIRTKPVRLKCADFIALIFSPRCEEGDYNVSFGLEGGTNYHDTSFSPPPKDSAR
jgi:hypothetical protein